MTYLDETVFGAVIDGDAVEAALVAYLQRWTPTYAGEMKRQRDPDDEIWPSSESSRFGFKEIETFSVVHFANEGWPEDQMPMYLIYSPGLGGSDRLRREGDGTVSARFICTVTAIASGAHLLDTKRLARLHSSAARAAILQPGSLDGFAAGVELVDHQNYPITKGADAERNLMGVSDSYLIDVPNVLDLTGGVTDPMENPVEAPPERLTVDEGGGSATVGLESTDTVEGLRESGFFGSAADLEED